MIESILFSLYRNRLAVSAVVIFAILSLFAFHLQRSTDRFARAYRDYAIVANTSDLGALVPGAANNPVRMQINDVLTQVLANKMSDAQRLELAKHGLELMTYSKGQIDAISPKLDATDASAKEMAASIDPLTSVFANGFPQKIVALAKERSTAVSDIRAYSYRADFETEKIFQHIVGQGGALPQSYIAELNNDVPATEEDFNARQNRYYDLQNIQGEISQNFADFSKRFSLKNTGE